MRISDKCRKVWCCQDVVDNKSNTKSKVSTCSQVSQYKAAILNHDIEIIETFTE